MRADLSIRLCGGVGIKSYGTKYAGEIDLLVQISISQFLKSHGGSYGVFSEPGFPRNFTQK
jgi:hypothetical protein